MYVRRWTVLCQLTRKEGKEVSVLPARSQVWNSFSRFLYYEPLPVDRAHLNRCWRAGGQLQWVSYTRHKEKKIYRAGVRAAISAAQGNDLGKLLGSLATV
jgi:hypothetical protein